MTASGGRAVVKERILHSPCHCRATVTAADDSCVGGNDSLSSSLQGGGDAADGKADARIEDRRYPHHCWPAVLEDGRVAASAAIGHHPPQN